MIVDMCTLQNISTFGPELTFVFSSPISFIDFLLPAYAPVALGFLPSDVI